jgi:hypothetical protein
MAAFDPRGIPELLPKFRQSKQILSPYEEIKTNKKQVKIAPPPPRTGGCHLMAAAPARL